jgi:hypothetical protein
MVLFVFEFQDLLVSRESNATWAIFTQVAARKYLSDMQSTHMRHHAIFCGSFGGIVGERKFWGIAQVSMDVDSQHWYVSINLNFEGG